jgi:hypothetical protein
MTRIEKNLIRWACELVGCQIISHLKEKKNNKIIGQRLADGFLFLFFAKD